MVEVRPKLERKLEGGGFLTIGMSKKNLVGGLEGPGPYTLGELSAAAGCDLGKFNVIGRRLTKISLKTTDVLELIGPDTLTVSSQKFPSGPRVVLSVEEARAQRVFSATPRDAAASSLPERSA
jgi:hypothetical protein